MIWNILLVIVTIYAVYLTVGIILTEVGLKGCIYNLSLEDKDAITHSKSFIKMCLNSLFENTLFMPLCYLSLLISDVFKKHE